MLEKIMCDLNTDWKTLLLSYPKLDQLEAIIQNEYTKDSNLNIFPHKENIFKCFSYFNISDLKVIILGQDPYHGEGQATGVAFAINTNECKKVPPSLRNIVSKLKYDYNKQLDYNKYNLEHIWRQGVLMMNTALTVIEGQPNSHSRIWKDFIQYILKSLNEKREFLICVAWGAHAYTMFNDTINTTKHKLLVSSHPSPLSCMKQFKSHSSFVGSTIFKDINKHVHINYF